MASERPRAVADFIGDLHGLNTLEHQPAKLAAIEAHWETASRVPLTLFAVPDESSETNLYSVEIPVLGSLILTHDPNGVVKGLKDWPREDRPPVAIPFFAFRIMVGIGIIMLGLVAASWWLRFKGRLFETPWFLRACELVAPLGFVAVLAGWTTTEVGRQPWTVYGLLRTADSVSPSLIGTDVLISLAGYIAAYLIIFPAGLLIMARMVRRGPVDSAADEGPVESGRPALPVRNFQPPPEPGAMNPSSSIPCRSGQSSSDSACFYTCCSTVSISGSASSSGSRPIGPRATS